MKKVTLKELDETVEIPHSCPSIELLYDAVFNQTLKKAEYYNINKVTIGKRRLHLIIEQQENVRSINSKLRHELYNCKTKDKEDV